MRYRGAFAPKINYNGFYQHFYVSKMFQICLKNAKIWHSKIFMYGF